MAIFALLWLRPYHNAELFVPILVWSHCAIFYRHFATCFCESFSFCLEPVELLLFVISFMGKLMGSAVISQMPGRFDIFKKIFFIIFA